MTKTILLSIDADKLTVGDVEDLEEAKKVSQLVTWLVKNAGANPDEIRALPIKDLRETMDSVRAQLAAAFALPKQNGDAS